MKSLHFALVFLLSLRKVRPEGCNINNFLTWTPVTISGDNLEVIYPSIQNSPDNRNISLPVGTTVLISCNGGRFDGTYKSTKTIQATCNGNSQLEAQDQILDYDTLDCINFKTISTKVTSEICAPNSIAIQEGFQIGLNITLVTQVESCFNMHDLSPVYVSYNLTKSIGFIKSYLTTSYIVDNVYNVTIDFDTVYNVSYQHNKINQLLGLPQDSNKYIDLSTCNPNPGVTTPGFCFTKRPLINKGHLVYISQQAVSFRYINIVPQWSFLDYNLDKLDRNIVDYVKQNLVDLEVSSGIFGIASFPHETTGEKVEIYLYDNGSNKVVPLPLFFWKLLYDPISLNAIVFFTVNNPHLNEDEISNYLLCEDVSDSVKWLTVEKHNATKGYTYACNYEDAKNVISYLPDLFVSGILV